jgi:hypothetical protein
VAVPGGTGLVALANAIGSQAAPQKREAAEIGWLKAHVRVGRSYPLLAVRVCRRAASSGGVLLVVESDHQAVLDSTVYAIAIARGLDALQARIAALDFDASLVGAELRLAVDLRVTPETGAWVEAETVVELARRVLTEAAPVRTWSAGELGDVRVQILQAVAPAAHVLGNPAEAVREGPPSARAESETVAAAAAVDTAESPHDVKQPDSPETTEDNVAGVEVPVAESRRGARRNAVLLGAVVGLVAVIAVAAALLRPQATPPQAAAPAAATSAAQAVQVSAAEAPTTAPVIAATRPAVAAAPQPQPVQDSATVAPTAVPTQLAPTAVAAGAPAGTTNTAATQPRETAVLDFAPDRRDGLGWPNQRQGVAWFDPDGYHLAARNAGQFVAVAVLSGDGLSDVSVTANFHKVGGPSGGGYGIIVGDQGPGPRDGINQSGTFFVFEVGDKGEVGVWRRDQDHWVDVLGWTPNPAARAGTGENTLVVQVANGQASFSVNGTDIPIQASGQTIISGRIGVFLGGDGNEAVLSRLQVDRLNR